MAREDDRKRGHPVRNTAVVAVLLAALLGGGRYGLGIGGGGGAGLLPEEGDSLLPEDASSAQTETVPEPEATEAPAQADSVLEIVVREDAILYEGEPVDLTGLEAALLRDYSGETTVSLIDDHAIKATYDEVAALLAALDIPAE